RVLADLEALDRLAEFAEEHSEGARRYRLVALLEEFRRTLLAELDYRREAQNLRALGRSLERFEHLAVPQPIDDYSSSRVLTMEYVVGVKVDEVSPLARLELDGAAIADELFEAYLVQVLVDGLFHADPHPGNLLLTDDGRLALIDLGMVGLVAPGLQDHLLKLLIALGEGKSDEVVERSLAMSETTSDSDLERFRRELNHRVLVLHGAAVEDVEVGRVILDLAGLAADCGVRVPQELSLLGKALLSLDHIARRLDPDFDANAAIRRHAGQLMSRRVRRDMSPGSLIGSLLEAKELAEQLPSRVNKILGVLADNQLRLEVDAFDEVAMIRAIQKVANRIAAGVVLAALIVGAALMMRVDTAFRLFGYPGFAMLCFLAAVAGGGVLLWNVVMHDREDRRDGRRR
ncbi:MAG TPA: AarF/UbiB family protein, partial [Thermoanaerobaculia bacterium]|nr:AarF/UbiB family protein [Thermoanaerobaculia bacterium]